jgi:hypothetical protein
MGATDGGGIYRCLPDAYQEVEWRDHATGEVLRAAGDPFPKGSMREVREAVWAKQNSDPGHA